MYLSREVSTGYLNRVKRKCQKPSRVSDQQLGILDWTTCGRGLISKGEGTRKSTDNFVRWKVSLLWVWVYSLVGLRPALVPTGILNLETVICVHEHPGPHYEWPDKQKYSVHSRTPAISDMMHWLHGAL